MAYTLNREHQIFSLYPNNIKEIYVIYESIYLEKQYMPMYFLNLYARKNIRMKFQLTYLTHHLSSILSFNIPRNREDLIMKMIWDFWIKHIPKEYEHSSIETFEADTGISFSNLEEELNRILVYTLGEEYITYDSDDIKTKMKNKEKSLK